MATISAELWRQTDTTFALHIDAEHKREIQNIKRSRDWYLITMHEKNGKVYAYQFRIHESDFRAAKRIEKRINESVHDSAKEGVLRGFC